MIHIEKSELKSIVNEKGEYEILLRKQPLLALETLTPHSKKMSIPQIDSTRSDFLSKTRVPRSIYLQLAGHLRAYIYIRKGVAS